MSLERPYLHDRWQDQIALESEMLAMGTERMQEKINKAREKDDMVNLRPHRNLLKEWVVPLSDNLAAQVAKQRHHFKTNGGRLPLYLKCIEQIPPDTAALIALRIVLGMLGRKHRGVLALATAIGTSCEHEARCASWKRNLPKDWKTTVRVYAAQKSTSAHQRRSRIALFNKYIQEEVDWQGWTNTERNRVGLELLNLVITTTRRFTIQPDPEWVPKRLKSGAWQSPPHTVEADPALAEWIEQALDAELLHTAVFLPCIIPPKPWEGPRGGGYWTPYVHAPFLIRFRASHDDQKQRALDEYARVDMPDVYSAINAVQETPWCINKRILDIANRVWGLDLAIAKMPRQEPATVPERPSGAEPGSPEYKEWSRAASDTRAANNTRFSNFLSYRRALKLADRMADEPAIYFPHKLDFRGRMYPIPTDLSPQGPDLHRGLLTFTNAKPVTEETSGWLAIQVANTWDIDKVSFDDRIQWVFDNEDMLLRIDADPLASREWSELDNPWQALAAVFEWCRYLREGPGMMSGLPVRIDGTCNGLQHLSAMVLDERAGASVNLVPGNKPRDIYQEVADILTRDIEDREDKPYMTQWLTLFGGRADRSITKRPVMILPYGGTKNAYFGYTMQWLIEHDHDCKVVPLEERTKAVQALVPMIWEAVGQTVNTAREVMEWLKTCSTIAAKVSKPIHWVTPSGFVVRHFYGTRERRRIDTLIDGQRLQLVEWTMTAKLDTRSQTKGIAPNFVHSMDASVLHDAVNMGTRNGLDSITTIHDAFGTVAADMFTLEDCLREAFVETYSEPVLADFLDRCKAVSGDDQPWPDPLPQGSLDLSVIRSSPYFFA